MKNILLITGVFSLISCATKDSRPAKELPDTLNVQKKEFPIEPRDTTTRSVIPPEIVALMDRQNLTPGNNVYEFTLRTDSTFVVTWGKKHSTRTTRYDFDLFLTERFSLKWENDKFLVLHAWTGSDWWFDLVLPLTGDSSEFRIENALTFDIRKSLVVSEYPASDTVMEISNLVTGKSQFIIEKKPCASALPHYCIDTVAFTKRGLYYRWTLPDILDKNKKYYEREVEVKI